MSNTSVNTALLEAKAKNVNPLDAELLLAHVLKTTRTKIIGWPETVLAENQKEQYDNLINKRAQHIPLAYLLGQKEFWSLPLCVSADVLTPRPETECLVEQALQLAHDWAVNGFANVIDRDFQRSRLGRKT